jgi:hypothetical protein
MKKYTNNKIMSSKTEKWKNLGRDLKKGRSDFIKKNKLEDYSEKTLTSEDCSALCKILENNYEVKSQITASDLKDFLTELRKTTKKKLIKSLKPSQDLHSTTHEKLSTLDFSSVSFQDFNSRISKFLNDFDLSSTKFDSFFIKSKILVEKSDLSLLSKQVQQVKSWESQEAVQNSLKDWYQSTHNTHDLRSKLMKTIQDYESLKSENLSTDEKISIENLLHSLKSQLKKIPRKSSGSLLTENFQEKSHQGLSEIFKHYSRQQFLLGKNPTFEHISKNLEILTLAKFLKFCKDFELIQPDSNERETRKRSKWAKVIFKKFSEYNRDMHEHHFLACMENVADFYLSQEYDKEHSTCFSNLPGPEKTLKFFEVMGFHDPLIYSKRLGNFSAHFGVEPYTRIPENDPSKKYRYDPEKYRKLKMSVDEWKNRKLENTQKYPEVKILRKKSEDFLKAYKRGKVSNNLAISIKPLQRKGFTFRELQELKHEDLSKLDEEFNINHLVDGSEDENLVKFFSKPIIQKTFSEPQITEPKFPAIIKNSDNQLAKVTNYSKKKK